MKKKLDFQMVKERHKETLFRAIEEKKVDPQMVSLCLEITEKENYFTSSGCSGRIMLLTFIGSKKDSSFHRKWHREVSFEELWQGVEAESRGDLWFKMESFILHIGCRNLEYAKKVLELKEKLGIRRGGIMVAKDEKFMLELIGSRTIVLPVKIGKKIIVEKKYLEEVLEKANKNLIKNYNLLLEIEKTFGSELT